MLNFDTTCQPIMPKIHTR